MENLQVPPSTTKDSQAYRIASTLMKLLNDNSVPEALWWLDDHTFAADPKFFQTQVLDPYFRGTKYASFLRTMHKMGFARLSRRFDLPKGVVAYACELFRKEKPDLMHKIRMCNSGKQAQALKEAMAKAKATQVAKDQAASASPDLKAKPLLSKAPMSPLMKKTRKPDPPCAGGSPSTIKRRTSTSSTSSAAELLQRPSPRTSFTAPSVRDLLDAKVDSSARLQMLREQTTLELNAQRMFLQRQHQMAQQEQLRRVSFLQQFGGAMPNPMGHAGAGTANLLELALLQESLANRLSGRR